MERHADIIYAHDDQVWGVAYSPDGLRLASVSADGTLRVWDVRKLMPIHMAKGSHSTGSPWSVAYSKDGKFIATQASQGGMILWDATLGQVAERINMGYKAPTLFTPDNRYLVGSNSDGTRVMLYGLERKDRLDLQIHNRYISCIAISPDGAYISSGDESGRLLTWDTVNKKILPEYRSDHKFTALAYAPDSKMLAVSDSSTALSLVDVRTGGREHCSSWSGHEQRSIGFSHDGDVFGTASQDGRVYMFDGKTLKRAEQLAGHTAAVNCLAFSPTADYVATGGKDSTIRLWKVKKPHYVS